MKTYEKRGRLWVALNSLWILVPILSLGTLSFGAFLYAGVKAKNTTWKIFGLVYLLTIIFGVTFPITAIGDRVIEGSFFVSAIHALLIRSKYLTQLNLIEDKKGTKQQKINDTDKKGKVKLGKAEK